MFRQYFAQRCRGGDNPLRVGTIAVGAIYYIQPDPWWRERFWGEPEHREPWIVEAFLNGTVEAVRRDPQTREWLPLYVKGRSDFALVRSLRTGRREHIAVRILQLHDDQGLSPCMQSYPILPAPSLVDAYFRRNYGSRPAARPACPSSEQIGLVPGGVS
jgi:hypothetical protein